MPINTPHLPEYAALLALLLAGGSSAPRRALLEQFACPQALLNAGAATWRAAGFSTEQISRLNTPDQAAIEQSKSWLSQPNHHLIGWHDPDYPALLRRISNPPLALFVAGNPSLLWHPAIAVVGSRSPTAGGYDNAQAFSRALARTGISIVSGMAAGIDAAAHEAVLNLDTGITIGVVGTGPDIVYPRQHGALREHIVERGAIVSEYLPGTAARPGHFPSRNRIIAGLALGTLVIEAAERSGALITARLTTENGREVFAVPGSIHNPLARGCHRLIRDGAALVESAQEIFTAITPIATELADALRQRIATAEQTTTNIPANASPLQQDDPDYQQLWDALAHDPTTMDTLVERTGLTAAALSSMLLILELDGKVVAEHGRYTRRP